MSVLQFKMGSPVGDLYLVASEIGLQCILFRRQAHPMAKTPRDSKFLAQAVRELEEYFAGKRKAFSVPLDLKGTPFQKRVWNQLLKIPYGKTASYSDVARGIQNAKAVRAVGSANGKNPVCIIVPCHRVIASDGSLGGYAGGLDLKTKLLKIEA